MKICKIKDFFETDKFLQISKNLYGNSYESLEKTKNRYIGALEKFKELYPARNEIQIFSAPGRTEIGGNHTDHQHGCVLAAAVNLDIIAIVSFHDENIIRVKSEGFEAFEIHLDDLAIHSGEMGTASIVRGIVAKFHGEGIKVLGFDLYCTSEIMCGSGISSSAAFEILIGTIIDAYYNQNRMGAIEIAKFGQFAENIYFGKKSGLMDQMVSSVGGLVFIDFYNTEKPIIEKFDFDFEKEGYCICITDTKGSHANLTADYIAIREEMELVASFFKQSFLRFVSEDDFYKNLPEIRNICSDRAINRASHFFSENNRVKKEFDALKNNKIEEFFRLVQESGDSSAMLLQNQFSLSNFTKQEIPLGIMLSKRILQICGAVRVHGGGFAGTIQAFVPISRLDLYKKTMDATFGKDSCSVLKIRPVGGIRIY